jgi:hypothetical protein
LEDLDLDGIVTLGKSLAEMGWDAINCIYLSKKRGRWENHVINHTSLLKSRRFLNWIRRMYLLTKGSAPWSWFLALQRNT